MGWGWEWGGGAEGTLSHGGFVDGEERLESRCFTLREESWAFCSVVPPV